MNYFISKLLFRISVANGNNNSQFEEMTILLQAVDPSEAYSKAVEAGEKNEDEFLNANFNKVNWKFEGVMHLQELPELGDGVILFSEIKDDYSGEQKTSISHRIHKLQRDFYTNAVLTA